MGTPETAVPSLRRLVDDGHEVLGVWTQPDRPAGRGNKLKASPVKEFARERGLIVHQPSKIKTDEAISLFTKQEFDAAIVVAYGRILPPAFLSAPRLGCLNVHFSLLPKYRGAAPVNWAIVRGEQVSGVTTMLMDEGLDTGPILMQRAINIEEGETAPRLLERLSHVGADLLGETLARLGEIEPRAQRNDDFTLAPLLRREDGVIDWAQDAFSIERLARGFQPWPNAYTFQGGRRLIIWRATASKFIAGDDGHSSLEAPGEIIEAHGDGLVVACGDSTTLRVAELQPEGKQRMSARDFINGARVRVGEVLG